MTSSHLETTLTIKNNRGLHARAAAKFVKCTEQYDAEVIVTKDDNRVSGTSIMGLMMLAASKGTYIIINASGEQAQDALFALTELVDGKFGEDQDDV